MYVDIDHISPSSIRLYLECPRKALLKLQGFQPLPHIYQESLDLGKAVHEIIEEYYNILPEAIVPKEIKIYLSKAASNRGIEIDDRIQIYLNGFSKFERERLLNGLKVEGVEVEFRKGILLGVVDAIFVDGNNTKILVDWKTGYLKLNELSDILKIQGTVYYYLTGISNIKFVFLKNGSSINLTYNDIKDVVPAIIDTLVKISRGDFAPNIGPHCAECEYRHVCLFGRGVGDVR